MTTATAQHTVGVWVGAEALRVEVARAAAAAAVELHEPASAAPTESEWAACDAVVLGPAAARRCVALPRRAGVVLVAGPGRADTALWQLAVRLGAEDVLELPADAEALLSAVSRGAGGHAPGGGGVLAVAAGHGGAGASVLAAALALTAPLPALLVDLDPTGPGLDLLLGIERQEGLRWPELRLHDGRIAAEALHRALPRRGSATVLAAAPADAAAPGDVAHGDGAGWDGPQPGAVRSVVRAGGDGGVTVVCDVSHQRTEAAGAALEAADLAVLVVSADVPSCAAAARAVRWVRARTDDVALVVRGPSPGGLRGGDVEAALGVPLVASMRPEPGLARRLERGGLGFGRRSPLHQAARAVHRLHALRPGAGAA